MGDANMDIAKVESEICKAVEEVMKNYGREGAPVFVMTMVHDDHFNYCMRADNNLSKMDLSEARLMTAKLRSSAESIEFCIKAGDAPSTIRDYDMKNRDNRQ